MDLYKTIMNYIYFFKRFLMILFSSLSSRPIRSRPKAREGKDSGRHAESERVLPGKSSRCRTRGRAPTADYYSPSSRGDLRVHQGQSHRTS